MDCRTAPVLSATAAAGIALRSRRRIPPPCWHRRSCRPARPVARDWAARSGSHRPPRAAPGDVPRLSSCGGAPGKVVERFTERAMHALRIFGGQNVLPPAFEDGSRRAAELGCDIKRPAEVLAGMTEAD